VSGRAVTQNSDALRTGGNDAPRGEAVLCAIDRMLCQSVLVARGVDARRPLHHRSGEIAGAPQDAGVEAQNRGPGSLPVTSPETGGGAGQRSDDRRGSRFARRAADRLCKGLLFEVLSAIRTCTFNTLVRQALAESDISRYGRMKFHT
jgi:hypothetical protein